MDSAQKKEKREAILSVHTPVKRAFFAYLFPGILSTLATSIYTLFDTIMIGQYEGDPGILALNIVLPVYSLAFAVGVLFGIGGGVRFSVAVSKGETETAKRVFTAALCGMLAVIALLTVLQNVLFTPFMRLLGADESSLPLVASYGRYATLGAPIFAYCIFMQNFVRNDRNPRLTMIAVVVGGITNILLDYIFVFPLRMGMMGAALATVVSYALNAMILSTHFFRKDCGLRLRFGFSLGLVFRIAGGGISGFIAELSGGIVIFAFNLQLLQYLGNAGVVVYGVISNVLFVAMSLFNGVAQACQPIISTNYGAEREDRVRSVTRMGLAAAALFGVVMLLLTQISPNFLVRLFTKEPSQAVLQMAPTAVRIYYSTVILMGLSIFFVLYFQSVMRARAAFVVSLLRGILLPVAAVLLLPLCFGAAAVWFAVPVAEVAACTVAVVLYCLRLRAIQKKALLSA